MTHWTRDTPWRQGHVLPMNAVHALQLYHPTSPDCICVVVISHDCDLANDNFNVEPSVEIIIGCVVDHGNGNFYWGKAPRTLHLDASHQGKNVVLELVATSKLVIAKHDLAQFVPDAAYSLSGKSLSVLRSWLAVRYNRAAFPDRFVECLENSKVDAGSAKLIKPVEQLLSAVYFDVDGGLESDHHNGSPYLLNIVLLYPSGDDPEQTKDKIEVLEQKIASLFANKFYDHAAETWSTVMLKNCLSISEDDMTVAYSRRLTEWRFEYMTLRAEEN